MWRATQPLHDDARRRDAHAVVESWHLAQRIGGGAAAPALARIDIAQAAQGLALPWQDAAELVGILAWRLGALGRRASPRAQPRHAGKRRGHRRPPAEEQPP